MLNNRKLILDTFCEVYELLSPWADRDFWDFGTLAIEPGAIYVVSRKEFYHNTAKVTQVIKDGQALVIMSNPAEGSETLASQIRQLGLEQLCFDQKFLILGGGDMDSRYPCLQFDSFLPKSMDYDENNQAAIDAQAIYTNLDKPYKFLFLNGRQRPHRKYLVERFDSTGLLDQAIWSCLDTRDAGSRKISYMHDGQDLMYNPREVKFLDPKYEVDRYRDGIGSSPANNETFIKSQLFGGEWGEIYLTPAPYIDTYFSVVTETVFDYPYSFRTEKIWKPIHIGHPFIAVANQGYYRDLHNLGFKTFGHLVDESFDSVENSQARIDRIAAVVEDLCKQDLKLFLSEAQEVCVHNQQRLAEARLEVRAQLPQRFIKFVTDHAINS
jgi:hypothetical protein